MFINKHKQYRLKSDEELMTLHKSEGGSICIGILYERYGHLVMGACMKYLKNTLEAEDMTMQIFENLGQKIIKHEIQFFKKEKNADVKAEFIRKYGVDRMVSLGK